MRATSSKGFVPSTQRAVLSAAVAAAQRQAWNQKRYSSTSGGEVKDGDASRAPTDSGEAKGTSDPALAAASFALHGAKADVNRAKTVHSAVAEPTEDPPEEFIDREQSHVTETMRSHGLNLEPTFIKKEKVREAFKVSVEARTVGNNQLRKYLKFLDVADWDSALEAAKGAQEGGLRLDAETCEMLLKLMLRAGQLKHAMELYQTMIANRICPHTKSYNHLIELAVEKKSAYAAKTLYEDMKRKGRSPDTETYELLMRAYALENPPQWEEAVEVFDRLQSKRGHRLTASTYNALMTVYLNMYPFDYRIVYNAYYEMRFATPRIRFGWDSYELVSKALTKGRAPWTHRIFLRLDAWSQIVTMWSPQFWGGAICIVAFILFVRYLIVKVMIYISGRPLMQDNAESTLDRE